MSQKCCNIIHHPTVESSNQQLGKRIQNVRGFAIAIIRKRKRTKINKKRPELAHLKKHNLPVQFQEHGFARLLGVLRPLLQHLAKGGAEEARPQRAHAFAASKESPRRRWLPDPCQWRPLHQVQRGRRLTSTASIFMPLLLTTPGAEIYHFSFVHWLHYNNLSITHHLLCWLCSMI